MLAILNDLKLAFGDVDWSLSEVLPVKIRVD
jgi:hypothetical protein